MRKAELIKLAEDADISYGDWYLEIIYLIPDNYQRGYIAAKADSLREVIYGEDFRLELISLFHKHLEPPNAECNNRQVLADVRNKLGPMQTVLDLIEEDDTIPTNSNMISLWGEVVERAKENIDIIRQMR
jgi:hypothetical protein